jgi:hypothetical protein
MNGLRETSSSDRIRSSEGNVGPGATDSKIKSGKMRSSKMKSGTTTGMSAGSHKIDRAGKNNDSK